MRPVKKILKSEGFRRVLGWVVAQYLRLVHATGRWQFIGTEVPKACWDRGEALIGCFWHGRMLMMAYSWHWPGRFVLLISGHRDGRLISDAMAHLGYPSISGSTSRGGSGALRGLAAELKAGASVGITPDGPRGPRMRAQPGVVKLAQLTGAPIIGVSFSARRRRVMSSWDRFILAWPFNSGVLIYGGPIYVRRDAGPDELEARRRDVEDMLNRLSDQADRMTGHTPIAPAEAPGTAPG